MPFFVPGGVDPGRHGGIRKLQANPLNLLGRYNDDRSGASAVKTRQVAAEHRNFGEFKVPSLRNVARTAPYMHNGSLATLADVVRHYSEINPGPAAFGRRSDSQAAPALGGRVGGPGGVPGKPERKRQRARTTAAGGILPAVTGQPNLRRFIAA